MKIHCTPYSWKYPSASLASFLSVVELQTVGENRLTGQGGECAYLPEVSGS